MNKKNVIANDKTLLDQEILTKLRNRDPFVRKEALKHIEDTADVRYIDEVLKLLNDRNEIIRADAVQAIFYLLKKKSLKYLIEKLDDKHRFVRSAAATFIGEIGKKSSLTNLENALIKERSNRAKVGILEGLYLLGQKKRIDEMLYLLGSKDNHVRASVVNTLQYFILEEDELNRVLNALRKALDTEPTILIKSYIEEALQRLKEKPNRKIREPANFL